MSPATRTRAALASVALLVGLAVASAAPAWSSAGHVLPASASPHGYSLDAMAAEAAAFTLSGNDPAAYPDTPFQVLHIDGADIEMVDGGIVATASKSFTVPAGTTLYVPLFGLTDEPPFLAGFPTTAAEARAYFYDPALHGGDFRLVVDGVATPIGPEYVASPVASGGVSIVMLGAFVGPLSVGTHTVTVAGGIYGAGVQESHGLSFIQEELVYTVVVQPAG